MEDNRSCKRTNRSEISNAGNDRSVASVVHLAVTCTEIFYFRLEQIKPFRELSPCEQPVFSEYQIRVATSIRY